MTTTETRQAGALPPICPGCGRFLRSEPERERGWCERCPAPVADQERPCCQSEPPCDDCPLRGEWSDK